MKVLGSVIFSVREWRSSAENLPSSDMMSNFPLEQLFWSFVVCVSVGGQNGRKRRSDALCLLSVYIMCECDNEHSEQVYACLF